MIFPSLDKYLHKSMMFIKDVGKGKKSEKRKVIGSNGSKQLNSSTVSFPCNP